MLNLSGSRTINSTLVDGFYADKTAYFNCEQIGSALEYADPRNAIGVIHKRYIDRLDPHCSIVKLTNVHPC